MTPPSTSSASASSSPATFGNPPVGCCTPRDDKVRLSVDLVKAARRHLAFLATISGCEAFRGVGFLRRTVWRYERLWMPLAAELAGRGTSPAMVLPPPDVQWVWHCHCLHPGEYREYCRTRFGALVERPAIFDEENEDYAYERGREIWQARYPSDPFDPEDIQLNEEEHGDDSGGVIQIEVEADGLLEMVEKHRDIWSSFRDPFLFETVYLFSARNRYRRFLHLCRESASAAAGNPPRRLVPTSDILLMWFTHQSFPVGYERDVEGIGDLGKVAVAIGESRTDMEVEATRKAWQEAFDEPYEIAGAYLRPSESPSRIAFYWEWEGSCANVNRRYKSLQPRFLLEVVVFLRGSWDGGGTAKDDNKTFLCLRPLRCHRELKLEAAVSTLTPHYWKKTWQLYPEFGTRGVSLEIRRRGGGILRRTKVISSTIFHWNEILRSPSLTLSRGMDRQAEAMVSVTPPVEAPYLLKCVPDRVTDDDGAMISDVILRMNGYHPQKGRWLSRTVLDHSRRECFVIRIRVAEGFWRRGAETPKAVKWEDRISEVREGPWSYVAGSVGRTPKKVVGTATPVEEDRQHKFVKWSLSTGETCTIRWDGVFSFHLENRDNDERVALERGRRLCYQPAHATQKEKHLADQDDDDDSFVTLIRYPQAFPSGKATALINWQLSAVEFLPEEDAVLVLLLLTTMVRTVSEVTGQDVGGLLTRRRTRGLDAGIRDWGSVLLPGSISRHLTPWFQNAGVVVGSLEVDNARRPPAAVPWLSQADGKDEMYRQVVIS